MRYHAKLIGKRLNEKLAKLSERDNKPLWNGYHINVVNLVGDNLQKFVLDVLSLGPKHLVGTETVSS